MICKTLICFLNACFNKRFFGKKTLQLHEILETPSVSEGTAEKEKDLMRGLCCLVIQFH